MLHVCVLHVCSTHVCESRTRIVLVEGRDTSLGHSRSGSRAGIPSGHGSRLRAEATLGRPACMAALRLSNISTLVPFSFVLFLSCAEASRSSGWISAAHRQAGSKVLGCISAPGTGKRALVSAGTAAPHHHVVPLPFLTSSLAPVAGSPQDLPWGAGTSHTELTALLSRTPQSTALGSPARCADYSSFCQTASSLEPARATHKFRVVSDFLVFSLLFLSSGI